MESLESKLDHLTPDQCREVEVFVEFLLYRSGYQQGVSDPAIVPRSVLKSVPPPLPVMELLSGQDTQPVMVHEQITMQAAPIPLEEPDEPSSPIQEITAGGDDLITWDYMDYGQFEQQSPATEAVKKVKAKIIQKNKQDTSRHLLDWID